MKSIGTPLFILGCTLGLIGGYLNPMNWYVNFKGEPSLMIYVYIALSVIGSMLMGYGIRQILIDDVMEYTS